MDSPLINDQAKQDQSRAKWTPSLDKIFVDLLVEQTRQNCVSNKKAWKHIWEQFNKQTGLNFDEQQLRNHHSVLRKWSNDIKSLLDQSGFSWNESQHMVMADEEVWENYIKVHLSTFLRYIFHRYHNFRLILKIYIYRYIQRLKQ